MPLRLYDCGAENPKPAEIPREVKLLALARDFRGNGNRNTDALCSTLHGNLLTYKCHKGVHIATRENRTELNRQPILGRHRYRIRLSVMSKNISLILLQREQLSSGSVLCDDLDQHTITRVNVALVTKKKEQIRWPKRS